MKKQNKIYQFVSNKKKSLVKPPTIPLSFFENKKAYESNQAFIVPNMASFIRDVTEYGNLGALKIRLLKLSLNDICVLIWWNKFNFLRLMRKEFHMGIFLLIQLEIIKVLKYKPSMIVLSDQICDLTTALNNSYVIKNFISLSKKLSIPFGLMTNNLPSTFKKLSSWKISPENIFTPINSYGYEMNPTKKEVENYLKFIEKNKIVAITSSSNSKETKYINQLGIVQQLRGWF